MRVSKMRKLPIYKGYTIDIRLKEFRKVDLKSGIKFILFDSDEGDKLLSGYLKTLKKGRLMTVAKEIF
jgi:hypothetical protein